ncbi:acyl-ACP--UDP-N-acetylglucosamine O-acyltransferase [Thalassoglobus polymorphus]|uniref:Acyl-[acyl-carrier-protein]--UDP-N-acetylglucosamine O-acyltransferase n=1 Tax=Thalassoglobus polymorphus TaxID=2527994 RepID=A0A517QJH5_9PLAN|nr:acyl-ACP--UDP-N-acetylglucosamine O-acyltransferase [Thalassoglobus polymorphus]QDT31745.1 Acyl-[acyl-carrier-protein]--UDP-N-acetylglucosamine O-acyltransferase [Thalassoglobus polymorphus]
MPTTISPLAHVDQNAQLGEDVTIGPFCYVGPNVTLGDRCILDSHVTITGHTTIGNENRFWPNSVIGAEPQDYSYADGAPTEVVIGDSNHFREGVTVNRGAEKEDGITRIGNSNLLMANAHVAHNCHLYNNTMLVNGVLLGGHVHVHDRAIISGNSVVHHFATIGSLAFVSGGCRVPTDIPPYMMSAGSDNPQIRTVNLIGMKRSGIPDTSIKVIRKAQRLLYREHKSLAFVKDHFQQELEGIFPIELVILLDAIEKQRAGRMGRAREAARTTPLVESKENQKKSA